MNDVIENKTFDEIQLGDRASLTGNFNLVDLNSGPKHSSMFGQSGGQAGWSATLFVILAGTQLPGLGSVAKRIEVRLHLPNIPHQNSAFDLAFMADSLLKSHDIISNFNNTKSFSFKSIVKGSMKCQI